MLPGIGDRVEITGLLPNDPNPLPIGTQGTVDYIGDPVQLHPDERKTTQIGVKWDNGSRLILLDRDPFRVVSG